MGNYSFYKFEYIEIITITDTKINFQQHSHADDFVITMINDGYADFVLNLKPTHISKGEIIIASPYEAHSLVSEAAVSIISVCVKKQAMSDLRETHRGRSDGAPKTTVAEELKKNLEEVANFEGSRVEQLLMI